jgi:tryptophanyl-tRNA synthetase
VAPKLGFYKPAQLHCKFIPGLGKGGKMSASEPETCIFTTDTPEVAEKKVMNAFTGGGGTAKEQRERGGNPDICTVYQYFYFFFEPSDEKVKEIYRSCREGEIVCGECKNILSEKAKKFLEIHQQEREKAKDVIHDFMLRD